MYQNNELYWVAAMCESDASTCMNHFAEQTSGNAFVKLAVLLLIFMSVIAFANIANAQIMPTQPPVDTTLGGTGASAQTFSRFAPQPNNTKTLQNLSGPNFGVGRDRHSIHMVKMTDAELPGIGGYYFRSSYVVLSPRGFAPIHSHNRRPAYLQVITGGVTQHRSDGISLSMGPGDFTFSSDQLAHWWANESADTFMRLWIVELCSADHGCKEKIEGGAIVVDGKAGRFDSPDKAAKPEQTKIMAIDLAGEFPKESGLGDRELRLRKIVVAPDTVISNADLGERPTYFRIAQGSLSTIDSGEVSSLPTHSIVYAGNAPDGPHWQNSGAEAAVLYVIDLVNP